MTTIATTQTKLIMSTQASQLQTTEEHVKKEKILKYGTHG